MKKTIVFLLVMAIALSMTACNNDPGGGTPAAQKVTYTGTANGTTYTLEITENTARYTAQSGDTYQLTVGTKISTGTVTAIVSGKLTLMPSKAATATATFTVTVSTNGITAMTGSITFDDGSKATAPTTLTPQANNNSSGDRKGTLRIVNNTDDVISKLVLQNAEYQDGGTTAYNWSYTYSTPIAKGATVDIPLSWPISLEKSQGFLYINVYIAPPLALAGPKLQNGKTTTVTATNDGNGWKSSAPQ